MKEEVASGQIKQVQGSTPVQLNLEMANVTARPAR